MIRKEFKIKSIFIILISISLAHCQKKPTQIHQVEYKPHITSGVTTIKGSGYIELKIKKEKKRMLFQALMDQNHQLYLEFKELGILGLVYGYHKGQTTMVIPKQKEVIFFDSEYPLQLWQPSSIKDKILFSILLYDFSSLFQSASFVGIEKDLRVYEVKNQYRFYLHPSNGRILKISFLNQDVNIMFGPLKQNMHFPSFIDIIEDNRKIHWVWKHIDINQEIPKEWFDVDIPKHYKVIRKQS